jgi:hypothetical protein
MAVTEREFYRSARGPSPSDEDAWRLVFDNSTGLFVRHEWQSKRHSGADDFAIAEFLAEQGAAQSALLNLLFCDTMADAYSRRAEKRPANATTSAVRAEAAGANSDVQAGLIALERGSARPRAGSCRDFAGCRPRQS